jgi:DNA-binding transcriptional MerR regulator
MVSIGEFSRLSRLSPKALRLYDELGLLVPAHVDAHTGYRWYAVTQLDQARLVASLRRAGVPLARIRQILALDRASAAEERILGHTHPETLITGQELARWRGEDGNPAAAVAGLEEVLTDRLTGSGADHPETVRTRDELARWRATFS